MSLMGWLKTVALAGGLVGLSGCGMVDAMKADLRRTFPGEGAAQASQVADPPPAETGRELAATHPVRTERVPSRRPEPKPLSPRSLVGMTQDETRNLLGNPNHEHSDPPATVWTWRNNKCEIDVFFYMDLSDRNFRALTYEVRGASKRESACLGELREEARRGRGAER